MLNIDSDINSYQSAADYVALCEKRFEKMLTNTVTSVLSPVAPKIITLSGPTCSGKTTTAAKLTDVIEILGYRARVLSIDDFYKDNLRFEDKPDFESAAAIDLDYFGECAEKLFSGKKVYLPTFDMKKGNRTALTEYYPHEEGIYIFEGIQAVYPEITSHLAPFGYKSIFISVAEDVTVNGVFFSKNEIRLIRRLVRDDRFRATGVEKTFSMWDNVRANEEKNIFPNAEKSDIKINSFLPYEILFIGKYLLPLLDCFVSSEYSDRASKLADKVKKVTNQYITEDMIPFRSVFREFIG